MRTSAPNSQVHFGHVDVVRSVNTIRLRRYGWSTSTDRILRTKKEKKNKVEEFQLANLANLGTLASNDIEICDEKNPSLSCRIADF